MTPLGAMQQSTAIGATETTQAGYNNIAQSPVLEATQAENDSTTKTSTKNAQIIQAQKDPLNLPIIGLIITAIIVFSLLIGLSLAKIKKN